jgi:hypothetical protein
MRSKSGRTWTRMLLLPVFLLTLFPSASQALQWWWPWPIPTPPTATNPNETKIRAVNDTISATQACQALGDFYWEIGDKSARLTAGKKGTTYDANTIVNLASSSKLPFAAYFLQRFGNPNSTQIQQLTMRSGYTNFIDVLCLVQNTIGTCFSAPSPQFPINNQPNAGDVGLFSYGSGHYQKLAVDAGLGNLTSSSLQSDMRSKLGSDTTVTVRSTSVASGLAMSGNGYGILLRKIMNNQLVIGNLMGSNKTCTQPQTCPTSLNSPISTRTWDYSLGHWVEHEPNSAPEAYSSVGYYGFYPWITADKLVYGLISTENTSSTVAGVNATDCGRNMRKAWLTGVMQN